MTSDTFINVKLRVAARTLGESHKEHQALCNDLNGSILRLMKAKGVQVFSSGVEISEGKAANYRGNIL